MQPAVSSAELLSGELEVLHQSSQPTIPVKAISLTIGYISLTTLIGKSLLQERAGRSSLQTFEAARGTVP
jgi:hypothetical protein